MDEMAYLKSNKSFVAEALKKRTVAPPSPAKEEGDDGKKKHNNEQEDKYVFLLILGSWNKTHKIQLFLKKFFGLI